jgi:UDP-N-acetylmuramoyl-L-alanyl-D-glutamate--2,6-diaminopimelate ligase
MGRIAQRRWPIAIVTSDNPRGEDPRAIIDEILAGMRSPARSVCVEVDRRAAIRRAIAEALPGDIVVVAGKGHETYQIVGDVDRRTSTIATKSAPRSQRAVAQARR